MKNFASFFIFLLSFSLAQGQYRHDVRDKSCGGFPKVTVGTFPRSCLGLIVDSSVQDPRTHETLKFPRKILELEKDRFIVTDMGGWTPKRGSLWELDLRSGHAELFKLVSQLTFAHDLEWGPDGNLYVGELGKIVRYSKQDLLERKTPRSAIVVQGIPTNLEHPNLHPLVNFAFGKTQTDAWDLYVNVGAPTDACVKDAPRACGVEKKQGLIRHYIYRAGINQWDPEATVYASGLRNSMGLLTHPSGTLLQAENSRDFDNDGEPFDELNLIQVSKKYGWPYCYNFEATSPEWKGVVNCKSNFEAPLILLPPHSAPLDLIYYHGSMFPELEGNLLMSWHGYRPTGSRIVAYPTDESGIPVWKESVSWSYSTGNSRAEAKPAGGNLRAADYTEIVGSWWKRDGVRPMGTPVGMTVASDGSIFIVEDKNKTILRLARSDDRSGDDSGDDADDARRKKAKADAAVKKLLANSKLFEGYKWINQYVIQPNCTSCHSQLKGAGTEPFEFMIAESWIEPGHPPNLLIKRLRGLEGLQKMPLGGSLPTTSVDYVEAWLKALN